MLSPREREYASLVDQLQALEADIRSARLVADRTRRSGLSWRDGTAPGPRVSLRGEEVVLPDGSQILVRPIESGDVPELRAGLHHLSALSRYRLYRGPVDDGPRVETIARADHQSNEAFVALDARTAEGVGLAQFHRRRDEPDCAELTYVVVDAWQGRGVGRALLTRLVRRAAALGVQRVVARVPVTDAPALRLLAHFTDDAHVRSDGDVIEVEARLRADTA